jgi:hypothetical protein
MSSEIKKSAFVLSSETGRYADLFKQLLCAEENYLAFMHKLADDEALRDCLDDWNELSARLFDCMEDSVLSAMNESMKKVCGRLSTPHEVL